MTVGQQETVETAETAETAGCSKRQWVSREQKGTAADRRINLLVQVQEDIPAWAGHWVNIRKGFANFYRTTATRYTERILQCV